jgi:hypothetical protein
MKHPSGAKARVGFAGLMYGLKPVPFPEKGVRNIQSGAAQADEEAPAGNRIRLPLILVT